MCHSWQSQLVFALTFFFFLSCFSCHSYDRSSEEAAPFDDTPFETLAQGVEEQAEQVEQVEDAQPGSHVSDDESPAPVETTTITTTTRMSVASATARTTVPKSLSFLSRLLDLGDVDLGLRGVLTVGAFEMRALLRGLTSAAELCH